MAQSTDLEVRQKQEFDESHGEATFEGRLYRPDVDIYADDANTVMLMDVPGASREGLSIDLRDRVLTVTAQVTQRATGLEPISTEFRIGGFRRRFTLTDDVAIDKIDATLKDGVLALVLPRAEHAVPRKIEVRHG